MDRSWHHCRLHLQPENGGMSHAESQTSGSFSLPPLNYDFIAPQKIVFGWGRRSEIGTLAASLGRRAFVVVGSRTLENNETVSQLVN